MIKSITAFASVLLLTLQLTGCVGGGGATGSGDSGSTGSATPTVTLSMTDDAGVSKRSITSGSGATVNVSVKNAAGLPVDRALVVVTVTDSTLAVLTPQSGTALTDTSGVAKVRIDAASINAFGALTVTADTTVDATDGTSTTVSGKLNFSVEATGVTLGTPKLPVGTTRVSSYATTSISVEVLGVPTTTSVPVTFSSTCSNAGKATVTPTVNSFNGIATTTYVDKGCASTDKVIANVAGTTVTSLPLEFVVSPPSASAIKFVNADPEKIVLKGTGGTGLFENSTVTFQLLDNNNQPIPGQNIELDLTTRSGGILLDGNSSGTVTAVTNADGKVSVRVTAGTTPTPVWVTAKHTTPADTTVSPPVAAFTRETQSAVLQISTGRPAQARFSLAIDTYNIEGLNINGTTTDVNIIASDRVGNPVPDGTAINFKSSGGQVGTESVGVCKTTNGACNAKFTSASPRPPQGAGWASGYVAITAFALGEETFIDANGNNVYDIGESFEDLGDIYVDANNSRTFTTGEETIQFQSATSVCANSIAGTEWAPSTPATCDGKWGSAHVRKGSFVILSGARINITPGTLTASPGSQCSPVSATFFAFDENNNPLPKGTQLEISNLPAEGWAYKISPSIVPNSSALGIGTQHTATFTPAGTPCVGFNAEITSTTPLGQSYTAINRIAVQSQALTVPGAPTIGLATAGAAASENISVAFTAPVNNGGSAISFYTATCSGGGATSRSNSGASSPIVVNMLGDATKAVTCSVAASNAQGVGASSSVSNTVTVP
jgi:hypothetical protein